MKRITFRITVAVFLLFAVHAATGQDLTKQVTLPATAPVITGTALAERLRFTAPSTVVQMQLQIYADSGQLLFDVTSKGNVLDWTLQNGSGEHLVPGLYLCVVTVKTLSGKISQRIGSALVQQKQIELQRVDATQMTARQQQAVGPIEENGALTILKAGETQATTVLANNGQEGQIIRDRGALSFRIGDFFSGNDKEQMRLTEEGNLGIGTAKPEAKLDVAGAVRARQGFVFNDGSTLNVNEKGALILTASDGTVAPNTAGTGTQNHLAKWLETGGAGTLGDSSVTELANGFVGIGTTNPQVRLDVVDDTSVVGGFQLTNHTNGATAQLQNRLANNAGAFAYYGITSSGYTQAPILSNRAFFGSFQADTVIWTQTANDILFATNGLSAATERMRIKSSGNVGIGTTNPNSLLDVAGDINTSAQYKIGGSSVLGYSGSPASGSLLVGFQAGTNATLSGNNTFVGAFAGQTNFGGSYGPYNTFIGASSGFTVSSPPGEGNTLVGGLSSIGSQSLFNATAIGYNATVTQSNSLVLGHSVNVGIGTTAPVSLLHVRGSSPLRILGDLSSLIGTESVDFMAYSSQFSSDLGGMRIKRQNSGDIDTIFLAATSGSSATEKMRVAGNGNVTITGCISASNISCPSDGRLKQNIRPLSYGLREVLRLRPVTWQWRETTTQPNLGLVAQEVEPVLPELVLHNTDSKDSLGLNYMGLIPVLVNSTREQQAEIEREQADLKLQAKQIAAQQLVISRQQEQTKQEQAQLHRQKAQLDALKRLICSLHPSASACQ